MDETPITIVREGIRSAMSPAAGMLIVSLFVINLFNHVTSSSLSVGLLRATGSEVGESGPLVVTALTWLPLAWLALMVGFLASVIFSIVVMRTFLQDRVDHIPPTAYRGTLVRPIYRLLLAGILTGGAVLAGMLVPLLPAIVAGIARMPVVAMFLAIPGGIIGVVAVARMLIGFLFVPVLIIDQELGVIAAIRESWEVSRSHRLTLFLTGLVVVAIVLSISLIGETIGGLVSMVSPTLELLVRIAGMSIATVVQWAAIVRAYEMLATGS